MITYPVEFTSFTNSKSGIKNNWSTQSKQGQETLCSVPTEFLGPGGALSPEDLYNHALANCFVATFKVYAQNSKLDFENIKVFSRLIVDHDENKKPVMKDFFLSAIIVAPSNPDKAIMLAKKATQSGFILNSVKTKCHFDITTT